MHFASVLAFIFDIDGTLVDSNELHVDSWDRAFRRFGKQFAPERLRAQIGKGSDQYLPAFLTPAEIKRFGKELDEYRSELFRKEYLPKIRPFACHLHSAYISDNTATKITYCYGGTGGGAPLVFHSGDAFSIRKVLIALDQNGRGKGDLITSSSLRPANWPRQQQETCFSWNNKNTDTNQVYGISTSIPTEHEGSDYINLGAGLPANQIPAPVTAAYPASMNGGAAYNHEYPYPHHLVTAGPSPTPTATSSPTATATATPGVRAACQRWIPIGGGLYCPVFLTACAAASPRSGMRMRADTAAFGAIPESYL